MVILKRTIFANKSTNCVQQQQLLLLQLHNSDQRHPSIAASPEDAAESRRRTIVEFLLDTCKDCAKMAALPQGAFAACKLRDVRGERDFTVARMKAAGDKGDPKNMFANKKLMEYSPVKYNGKLMNSIWGLYNRYSPHNIKGNEYEVAQDAHMQQPIAVASFAIAQNLRTMATNSRNEWSFAEK